MLIKEYRIPMPMSVEEYRIAQLYMIQKKSRQESEGEGSAVEILENRPYTDKDGTIGQYTKKIYHIGKHLPGWIRSMIPKTALQVEEESWNAYPHTRTIFRCPFVEKFSLDVDTYFFDDKGDKKNPFNLKGAELKNRVIDWIDIVKDHLSNSDYKEEEDPRIYKSKRTGRGPLDDNWRKNDMVMCIYKLCKVEFRYWGMQSRIEHYIHDYGLRRIMLRAHRQAWAWQDEWMDLTMDDIRRLEKEAQIELRRKLGQPISDEEDGDGDVEDSGEEATVTSSAVSVTKSNQTLPSNGAIVSGSQTSTLSSDIGKPEETIQPPVEMEESLKVPVSIKDETGSTDGTPKAVMRLHSSDNTDLLERRRKSSSLRRKSLKRGTRHSKRQASLPDTSIDTQLLNTSNILSRGHSSSTDSELVPYCGLDAVAMLNISSDDEYYDALDDVGGIQVCAAYSSPEIVTPTKPDGSCLQTPFMASTTLPLREPSGSILDSPSPSISSPPPSPWPMHMQPASLYVSSCEDVHAEAAATPTSTKHTLFNKQSSYFTLVGEVDCLFLIIHGGTVLKSKLSKEYDKDTITETITKLMKSHFHGQGNIAIRMVACESLTAEVCHLMKILKPDSGFCSNDDGQSRSDSDDIDPDANLTALPIALMAVLSTESTLYAKVLREVINQANTQYNEFLRSEEGQGFNGQVCLLADCMGSLVAYDILTRPNTMRRASVSLGSSLPQLDLKGQMSGLSRRQSIPVGPDGAGKFCFEVTHFFCFGSPLGAVLTSRRYQQSQQENDAIISPIKPRCTMFYNVFYAADPLAYRIEPLLEERLARIPPISIPRFRTYPMGDGTSIKVKNSLTKHAGLFYPYCEVDVNRNSSKKHSHSSLEVEETSQDFSASLSVNPSSIAAIDSVAALFWSPYRIDYILEPPSAVEGLNVVPLSASPHVIHSRYWEAKEFLSFVLRQVFQEGSRATHKAVSWEPTPFVFQRRTEKWSKKRTAIMIRGFNPGHRAIDSIVLATDQQTVTGRFSYGPLDLAGEQVDVYVHISKGKWQYIDTVTTDKQGKVTYSVPNEKRLSEGWYPVKMVVKGDHTTADSNLVVVPPHTEAVVFSVDGSFAANISLSAKDVKVKDGAVEVVRLWQERGYLIIYVTGRPEFQKDAVITWLAKHQFPLGVVSCCETISTVNEMRANKVLYLGRLIRQGKIVINCAYGSSKDVSVYKDLGLQKNQIYIVSKRSSNSRSTTKKLNATDYQALIEGYPSHLQELRTVPPRMATVDMRPLISYQCFVPHSRKPSSSKPRSSKKMPVLESAI